jgi:hypothetical protein
MKISCVVKLAGELEKLEKKVEEQKKMIDRLVKQLHRKANIRIDIEEDL